MGGSKTFKIKKKKKVGYLDIWNAVNNKVAKFGKYDLHWGFNHLLSVKSIKIEKGKGTGHIKLFSPV